jgi:hypothetical protein
MTGGATRLATGGTIASDPVLTTSACGPTSPPGAAPRPISRPLGPSPGNCIDRRLFGFRLHHPRGQRVVRAVVFVNGRIAKRVHGRNLRQVALRRLPQGDFVVKIRTTTNAGTVATSRRRYRGCSKTRPHNHTAPRHPRPAPRR